MEASAPCWPLEDLKLIPRLLSALGQQFPSQTAMHVCRNESICPRSRECPAGACLGFREMTPGERR